jgi:EgtB-related family protein
MVELPGGSFRMGTDDAAGFRSDGEGPVRTVEVSPFLIDRFAVSNERFARFVADTAYVTEAERFGWSYVFVGFLPAALRRMSPRPEVTPWWAAVTGADWRRPEGPGSDVDDRPDHPVVHVSWEDATAYAAWAGARLPTEAEWEYAAAAGAQARRTHPWGDALPGPEHATTDWRSVGTVDVAACPDGDSPLGCRQLVGNVWEWTASDFTAYPNFERDAYAENSEQFFGSRKVLRGGAWATRGRYLRNTYRNYFTPDRRDVLAGFRTCALDL